MFRETLGPTPLSRRPSRVLRVLPVTPFHVAVQCLVAHRHERSVSRAPSLFLLLFFCFVLLFLVFFCFFFITTPTPNTPSRTLQTRIAHALATVGLPLDLQGALLCCNQSVHRCGASTGLFLFLKQYHFIASKF